jgi:hypothetical protein
MFDWIKFNHIPTITDEDLLPLARQIRPVKHTATGYRFFDLSEYVAKDEVNAYRGISCIWTEQLVPGKACLHDIGAFITYHSFGAPSLFKPSVAEVIAQIRAQVPAEWLTRIRGFGFDTGDMSAYHVLGHGYHFAKCHLFEEHVCDATDRLFNNREIRRLLAGDMKPHDHGTVVGYRSHTGIVLYPRYQIIERGERLHCVDKHFMDKESHVTNGQVYRALREPKWDGRGRRLVAVIDDWCGVALVPVEYFRVLRTQGE